MMTTFMIASTPSDAHTWNLVFLQLLIEEYDYEVLNIGNCVPVELLIERCRQEQPEYLVISSVNGHGLQDGLRIASAIRGDERLDGMGLIIGGKLDTQDNNGAEIERTLFAGGYDHVFLGDHAVASFRMFLEAQVMLRPVRAGLRDTAQSRVGVRTGYCAGAPA